MLEQSLRPYYQQLFIDPLAKLLQYKVKPYQVTLLSVVLGVLVFPALLGGFIYLAIALLLASGVADTLDGTIARMTEQASDWGSVIDIMADRLVEFIVILALWAVAPNERSLACLFMLGSSLLCITSFLVVGIFSQNSSEKSFHYSPGIIERAEAFIFFISMMLLPNLFIPLALLFTILVLITAILRLKEFWTVQA